MTKPLHLPDLLPTLTTTPHLALFLDYDGTLIPYHPTPDAVTTPPLTLRLLERLTLNPDLHLIIITGRTLDDIRTKIPTPNTGYAALHGRDISLPDIPTFHYTIPPSIADKMNTIKKAAQQSFHEPGLLIEDKPDALAFHYRQIPPDREQQTIDNIDRFIASHDPERLFDRVHGAKVIELRPKGWNKGKAVDFILATLSFPCPPLPIYIGDDTTDEDAFIALQNDGITIRVLYDPAQRTNAAYTVTSPNDVIFFLEFLNSVKTSPPKPLVRRGG